MAEQQVFSDRYELVRHIARGGMAQVYLAKDLQLDRHVALKVLFPELSVDRSFVERFRREAQAAASLSHPNIVSVYDWGQGERTYFIVMEYIDGHTLSSLIRQGPFDADRAAVIGSEVAAALQFAHGKGVIHRDVKPGNVLLDRAGQVKVTDFGIARAVGAKEGLTQTGSVMGTATYFSPEQAQGFAVDARSDVYSLGIVLYEMVVGKPPFAGDNPVSIAYKHVREEPVAPRVANPAVPPAFDSIVMKAMAKDAGERYPTAGELRDDLLRFHHGEAVTAGYAATTVVAPAVNPTRAQPRTAATVDTYERRSYTGLVVALVVLLLAVLGALAFFLTRSNAKTLSIPSDLVGKPVAAAQTELTSRGFTNVATTNAPSDQVAQGLVISTNPPVGTSVKTNAAVTLVVSTGAAAVTVPNVVNQDQQSATNTLASSGFKVTVTTASSDQVAQGLVISTNPPAGTSAAKGSTVAIVVSTGKQQVTIPSLVGQSSAAAGSKLGSLQLTVVEANESSASIAPGDVTRTNPPAGTMVAPGTQVTVFVSTGTSVPNLVGLPRSQADANLRAAGLKGSYTPQSVSDASQNGMVISQSVPAGTALPPGSTVDVVVGAYAATTTTPPSTTSPTPTG